MGRTFQYQGLAKVISTPVVNPASIPAFSQSEPVLRSGTRIKRFAEFQPASVLPSFITAPPYNPINEARQADHQLPVRSRSFRAWYQPATAWVDIFTIPAPQRAYTCLEMPVKLIRRFAAGSVRADAGFPFFTLPVPAQKYQGADPLPVKSRKVGAAYYPACTFISQSNMPAPVQVYQSADPLPRMIHKPNLNYLGSDATQGPWWLLDVRPGAAFARLEEPTLKRRIRLVPDQPSFADSFERLPAIGGAFSQQQVPEPRKRIKLTPESSIFMRDFAAPAYCWSQMSELPPKLKQRNTQGDCTPFGLLRNAPLMFGTPQHQPTRAKVRPVVDSTQTSHPVTTNELRLGGFFCQSAGPMKNLSSKVWLHWQNTMQFYTGPPPSDAALAGYVDFLRMVLGWWSGNGSGGGGGGGGGGTQTPCVIDLIGVDTTVVDLSGTDETVEITVELTGVDNTLVDLTGEC